MSMLRLLSDDTPQSQDGTPALSRVELTPVEGLRPSRILRTAGEDTPHLRRLAESGTFPPIAVHRPTMRIVDGMHRLRAAMLRGDKFIHARFAGGSLEDAFVLAVQLNGAHGLPLSQADRTAAARRILGSHPHWSDRRIATIAGISPSTVGSLRSRSTSRNAQSNARAGRDGRVRPLDAARGRRRASEYIVDNPDASLRTIASVAGIALATARDVRERLRRGENPVPPKLRASEMRRGIDSPLEPNDAPGPQAPPHPAAATRTTGRPDMPSLRKDPSLRLTESGRSLLSLLSGQQLGEERWHWLAQGVPPHRAADVALFARQCGERWLRFAQEVETRAGADTCPA
jgi:ParB-like chromosome segregation protein Spo0J